ncbi:MAG: type III PLP-dependent enzyme [Chromatiales bacterium]|nr:type III PLP-dependent enzyme [Chromatiales bacterium]
MVEPRRFEELIAKHGTPLLALDRRRLRANVELLRRELPGVEIYYAVKANPHPIVLETMRDMGCGFDVASYDELRTVLDSRGPLERCLYTHPTKRPDEIERMLAAGIKTWFFDNASELDKLAAMAPGSRVVLRVRAANPDCVVDLSEKFGTAPDEAEGLLGLAIDKGLKPVGLAFHVGSQTSIPQPYVDMITTAKRIFDHMQVRGHPLELLDIGGGFPVDYGRGMVMDFELFCAPIRAALQTYFPSTRVIAEPGRFVVADAATLALRVISHAERNGLMWYYVEDGVYGAFSGHVFDHAKYRFSTQVQGPPRPCIIAGPTCDSFDVIARDAYLPELAVGDLLFAHEMGAYTNASATTFNGIPLTPVVEV